MSYNTLRQVTSREVTWQSKLYNIRQPQPFPLANEATQRADADEVAIKHLCLGNLLRSKLEEYVVHAYILLLTWLTV